MYSTELAFIFILIAIAVALVVWFTFMSKVAVDESYESLETIYPPESFPCFDCCLTDICGCAWEMNTFDKECLLQE